MKIIIAPKPVGKFKGGFSWVPEGDPLCMPKPKQPFIGSSTRQATTVAIVAEWTGTLEDLRARYAQSARIGWYASEMDAAKFGAEMAKAVTEFADQFAEGDRLTSSGG